MAAQPYVGQVQSFAFDFAPRGWALCAGQLMPINQYQALFALLGTYYGGNGTTNFGLPNLQGRAVRGFGQGPGLSACQMGQINGVENATMTINQLPAHNHLLTTIPGNAAKVSSAPATDAAATPTINTLAALTDPSVGALNNFYNAATPDVALNTGASAPSLANTGGNMPIAIMQPYLVINYSIALVGIFPSRN